MLLYHIILFTLQYYTMYCKNTEYIIFPQDVPAVAVASVCLAYYSKSRVFWEVSRKKRMQGLPNPS